MQISANYNLEDFTRSQTATRLGFTEQFTPNDEVINNLKNLVTNLLQPLRTYLGPGLVVSSGYRCERLNEAVKGKIHSQHLKGQAVDIEFYENGVKDDKRISDAVIHLQLDFDQMLNEYNFAWIHLSLCIGTNRKENLTIT